MKLVPIGFGGFVPASRVVVLFAAPSLPAIRAVRYARARKLIDVTQGRRARSVMVMESGHVVVSALAPGALAARIKEEGK